MPRVGPGSRLNGQQRAEVLPRGPTNTAGSPAVGVTLHPGSGAHPTQAWIPPDFKRGRDRVGGRMEDELLRLDPSRTPESVAVVVEKWSRPCTACVKILAAL